MRQSTSCMVSVGDTIRSTQSISCRSTFHFSIQACWSSRAATDSLSASVLILVLKISMLVSASFIVKLFGKPFQYHVKGFPQYFFGQGKRFAADAPAFVVKTQQGVKRCEGRAPERFERHAVDLASFHRIAGKFFHRCLEIAGHGFKRIIAVGRSPEHLDR